MTASEFNLWLEYMQLEPFGCLAEDERAAKTIQAQCASNGCSAPDFFDLFPRHEWIKPKAEAKPMTPDELYAHFKNTLG